MSKLKDTTRVVSFFSVLYRSDIFQDTAILDIFKSDFSLLSLSLYPCSYFPMKDYYSKEMGDESLLKRVFIFSSKKIERSELVNLKVLAQEIEYKYSITDNRRINIDPGYVALEQVVLSTGKPYSHRIYLDKGVFAELTYEFKDSTFKALPWTYPDYCHDEIINFFNYIRRL